MGRISRKKDYEGVVYTNNRKYRKIYKRAEEKVLAEYQNCRGLSCARWEKAQLVLTPLERHVFQKEQAKRLRLVDEIMDELQTKE